MPKGLDGRGVPTGLLKTSPCRKKRLPQYPHEIEGLVIGRMEKPGNEKTVPFVQGRERTAGLKGRKLCKRRKK